MYITLFFVWERLQSVPFIHSLRLLHLVNISLAAKESGKAVWLPPDFVSLACSSAPNRDLAPQVKERGELAESLSFAFLDCLQGGKGLMLLFLVISIYAYLTFSINDFFLLQKDFVCS